MKYPHIQCMFYMRRFFFWLSICKRSITHIGLKVNNPRQNETSMGEGEKYHFYVPTMVNNYMSSPNNNPTEQNKREGSNGWMYLKRITSIFSTSVHAHCLRETHCCHQHECKLNIEHNSRPDINVLKLLILSFVFISGCLPIR